MDVNIIVVGIISGVALILGIKNWSRNRQIDEHFNLLTLEKNILKEDIEKQINALKEDVNELKKVNQTLEKTPEYLDRIARRDAITISKFNDLLKQWFNNSREPRISEEIVGVRDWIHIKDGKKIYRLNSDTTLCGVKEYLKKYTNSDWVIVENQRGNRNKVAFGTEKKHIIEGFYLYLVQ